MGLSVGQNTASGTTNPPLNITNPTPGLDTKGFLFNHGPGETQLLNQLERPGGQSLDTQHSLGPLSHFKGAWSGNGFNMLWAPRHIQPPEKFDLNTDHGPNDNTLIAQLTTEQWTFSPALGNVLNRGFVSQDDIILTGVAYLQTVQNVSNPDKGDGSRLSSTFGSGLHFEPGLFLFVPKSKHDEVESIVRMASIPHGTTINAQGLVPPDKAVGGKPNFDKFQLNTKPFPITDQKKERMKIFDKALALENNNRFRDPQDLRQFHTHKTITGEIIVNPNKVLANAISGLKVLEHITFEVFTDPSPATTGKLTAGGTTNISFLHGNMAPAPALKDAPRPDTPAIDTRLITSSSANARAARMSSRFWIEKVEYDLTVPQTMKEGESLLIMPALARTTHEPPTPKFMITAPKGGLKVDDKITAVGAQIQYSQVVDLEFGTIVWPHASVATLVPTDAQHWTPQPTASAPTPTPPKPITVQKPAGGK